VGNQILIAGYIGFGNAGDEAIAETMVRHLREEIPGIELTIISGNPEQTAGALGVRAIGWREPLEIVEAVHQADLTIIGGGGLFQDYWGVNPDSVMTREHWGLSFYVAPALIAALCGRPVMLYAIGAGPLFSEHGRKFTKAAAEIAGCVTVRDAASQKLLEDLGIPGEKIVLTADPAFDLKPVTPEETPQIAEWTSAHPAIAVSVRNWSFAIDQGFCEQQIAAALDEFLETEGGRVLFVPFHLDPGNQDDAQVSERILQQLQHRDRAAVLKGEHTAAEIAGILGQADLVLGMRLHSVILSLCAKVPVVALEYDPKLGGVAALTGLEEYTIPIGGIEQKMLAAKLRQALQNADAFRQMAEEIVPRLRTRARENAAMAHRLLNVAPASHYSPDTQEVIGRLVMAQVKTAEALFERLRASCEVVDPSLLAMPPVEMAGTLVWRVNDLKNRELAAREEGKAREFSLGHELNVTRSRLDDLSEDLARVRAEAEAAQGARNWFEQEYHKALREVENRRHEAEAASRRSAAEISQLSDQLASLKPQLEAERQTSARSNAELKNAQAAADRAERHRKALLEKLAPYEAKNAGAIFKRGVQVLLDAVQWITPAFLRAAVRKQYLHWFYYRLYPERRHSATSDHAG
jgi:polysaccharide pyruvyl transferase CsaB